MANFESQLIALIDSANEICGVAEKYATQNFAEARTKLLASRVNMVSYLKNLSVQDRAAAAQHRTFGSITIESMLQVLLDHDKEHQASIS